jgi:hypothetical protein
MKASFIAMKLTTTKKKEVPWNRIGKQRIEAGTITREQGRKEFENSAELF